MLDISILQLLPWWLANAVLLQLVLLQLVVAGAGVGADRTVERSSVVVQQHVATHVLDEGEGLTTHLSNINNLVIKFQ